MSRIISTSDFGPGHLSVSHVTPADEQDRAQVRQLAKAAQKLTDQRVTLAYVDQGYAGEHAAQAAPSCT